MTTSRPFILVALALISLFAWSSTCGQSLTESRAQHDARMQWWREARFGMFIHWGLYAIPAGTWGDKTNYGEWIRTSAQIPLKTYDTLTRYFNPVQFDAKAWVRMAKDAGMQYIVITSKHHDGFCLFDSKQTDFDIMSTPFKRDILRELADACRTEGMRLCFYHSIMDWHHPDYVPRREWETDRSAEGAVFDRYVDYMKNQIRELLSKYGDIGVLWFDGEWESTWTNDRGRDLYRYVRSLQPNILINNRVGAGRSGMEGFTKDGEFAGDFGTPEQQIPATGLPGVDWETCMTMNDHWGYNRNNHNWKSTREIIRMLADIVSKGGNYLLNVGPTAEGLFPESSIVRLKQVGEWMRVNEESIRGTKASPFDKLPWGRCTQRMTHEGTRLYLHVFDWPSDGLLAVPGIFNECRRAFLLADGTEKPLVVTRNEDALILRVPAKAPDQSNSVIVMDLIGQPDVSSEPIIDTSFSSFVSELFVACSTVQENVELRYSLDGSIPTSASSRVDGVVRVSHTSVLGLRAFRNGKDAGPVARHEFRKVDAWPSVSEYHRGIQYRYFEGAWDRIPDFAQLAPVASGVLDSLTVSPRLREEEFAFQFDGSFRIAESDVYAVSLSSDDGSRIFIDGRMVVDNDGLHGLEAKRGVAPLAAGVHVMRVEYFERSGSQGLEVAIQRRGESAQAVPWLRR